MGNKIDMIGKRFGRLVVLEEAEKKGKRLNYLCQCDCGNKVTVIGESLRSGATKSCGCYNREKSRSDGFDVGVRRSMPKLYEVWRGMIRRCEDPNRNYYHRYGGRGISVCKEWHDSAVFIKWALDNGYKEGLQIDRIDNDGNYCPENCRWTTPKENSRNTSTTVWIEFQGEKKSLQEWAEITGIHPEVIRWRYKNWDNIEDVFREYLDG